MSVPPNLRMTAAQSCGNCIALKAAGNKYQCSRYGNTEVKPSLVCDAWQENNK